VRAECHGAQTFSIVRSTNLTFSLGFSLWIKGVEMVRVILLLVYPKKILTRMHYTRGACKDECPYPRTLASGDYIPSAFNISMKEISVAAPHINFCCRVKHSIITLKKMSPRFHWRSDINLSSTDADRVELWVGLARET
jgi:hypothetical protein